MSNLKECVVYTQRDLLENGNEELCETYRINEANVI